MGCHPAHFPRTQRCARRCSVQQLTKPAHPPISDLNRTWGKTVALKTMSTHEKQQAFKGTPLECSPPPWQTLSQSLGLRAKGDRCFCFSQVEKGQLKFGPLISLPLDGFIERLWLELGSLGFSFSICDGTLMMNLHQRSLFQFSSGNTGPF